MNMSGAERQAAYRRKKKHGEDGEDGDGGFCRLDLWLPYHAFLALKRLARHQGKLQREVLGDLLLAANTEVTKDMKSDAWEHYHREPDVKK